MEYYIGWKFSNDTEWEKEICLAFLTYKSECLKKRNEDSILNLRFRNDWDKIKEHSFSTKDWLDVVNSLGWKDKYFDLFCDEDWIYISFDISKVSYEWMLSIVSVLRLAGEYTGVITGFVRVKKTYPLIKNWDALFIAHQLLLSKDYHYNSGHTLFVPGQKNFDVFNFEKTKELLDNCTIYKDWNMDDGYINIQRTFHPLNYGNYRRPDQPRWREELFGTNEPYFYNGKELTIVEGEKIDETDCDFAWI